MIPLEADFPQLFLPLGPTSTNLEKWMKWVHSCNWSLHDSIAFREPSRARDWKMFSIQATSSDQRSQGGTTIMMMMVSQWLPWMLMLRTFSVVVFVLTTTTTSTIVISIITIIPNYQGTLQRETCRCIFVRMYVRSSPLDTKSTRDRPSLFFH